MTTTPSHSGVSHMKRHQEFYFRDGNISFLVGNTVFRVHRLFFERDSEYFRERLASPGDGDSEKGSAEHPFIIHDVESDDFAQLVWVWYNPKYTYAKQSKERWLTILRLSTMWSFDEIKKLAIRQLEKLNLPPIEKISTYKRFQVDNRLLLTSYITLCQRDSLPSPEEGNILGMETVLQLAASRERALASGCPSPTSPTAVPGVLEAIVAELFLGAANSTKTSANNSTVIDTAKQPNKTGERNNAVNGGNSNKAKVK